MADINKILTKCYTCSFEFFIHPSRIKYGRGKYCSKACQTNGIKNVKRSPWIDRECLYCHSVFSIRSSDISEKYKRGKFCSSKCKYANRICVSEEIYITGKKMRRSSIWKEIRKQILERDRYTCQKCYNDGNDVHHIIPFRKFTISEKHLSNDPRNLITLCRSCHLSEDQAFRKTEKLNNVR